MTLSRVISHGDKCRRECLNFKPARVVWAFCIVGLIVNAIAESKPVVDALERAEIKQERGKINRYLHANGKDESIIFELIAGGNTVDQVAKLIGVSRIGLGKWLDTAERRLALARARSDAADALVEMALSLPDQADTALDMKRAEVKTKTLLWTAGKWNRELYGDSPLVQVNITAGEAHLNALRKRATSALDASVTRESTGVDRQRDPEA